MIIGAIVLFKMSDPIRLKYPAWKESLSGMEHGNQQKAVAEIERLVLNAVQT
jgi:hypothetical protein